MVPAAIALQSGQKETQFSLLNFLGVNRPFQIKCALPIEDVTDLNSKVFNSTGYFISFFLEIQTEETFWLDTSGFLVPVCFFFLFFFFFRKSKWKAWESRTQFYQIGKKKKKKKSGNPLTSSLRGGHNFSWTAQYTYCIITYVSCRCVSDWQFHQCDALECLVYYSISQSVNKHKEGKIKLHCVHIIHSQYYTAKPRNTNFQNTKPW